jgi:glutaminyl-peptide cyclotransferase
MVSRFPTKSGKSPLAFPHPPTFLVAHIVSSLNPTHADDQFIGATDSAAPCAMLLDLAESLTPLLKARLDRVQSQQGILRDGFDEEESSDTTLTILFLDGEEAFHDWTDTDSIYGARHLSQLWQDTYPPHSEESRLGSRRYEPIPTYIETIDHFILLDLLGNSHSRLNSYYRETDWLFDEMSDVDKRLREQGLVEVEKGESDWFQKLRMRPGMIGDDHLPVQPSLSRGVIS